MDGYIHIVLMRLPAKSLMRLKLVCKSWNALISDPYFAESHHIHARTRADASSMLFYFLTKNLRSRAIFPTDVEAICSTELPIHTFSTFMPCTNVVNGLVCLCDDFDKNRLHILNVTTGEHIALPKGKTVFPKGKSSSPISPDEIMDCNPSYFLGFDPFTKNYKLLNFQKIKRMEDKDYVLDKCYVLTLGANKSWREIDCPSFQIGDETVSLDGAIYWKVILRAKNRSLIPFFDVEGEKFLGRRCPDAILSIDLVTQVGGGNLAFLSKDQTSWTLWTLKDTWRGMKLQIPCSSGLPFDLEAIGITNRDEIMLMVTPNRDPKMPKTLMFYGLKTGRFRSTKISLPDWLPIEASNALSVFADAAISNHVENIVHLKALIGTEHDPPLTRQRVTKSVNLTKFTYTII